MEKFQIENLDQKFEYGTFQIFFAVQDSLPAEEVLNTLDRSSEWLKKIFDIVETPRMCVFIYSDPASFEKSTGRPIGPNETVRVLPGENVMLLCSCRLPKMIDEEVSRQLSYMVFTEEMGDREIATHQYRCPSWLREGACLQGSSRLRRDSKVYLLDGWAALQEAEKTDKLIKPSVMVKNINLIPDPLRRSLALHEAFFMIKYLISLYPEKFFHRYGTLMKALEDLDAEKAFSQITGLSVDKFFWLFREWIRTTNGLVAISDG